MDPAGGCGCGATAVDEATGEELVVEASPEVAAVTEVEDPATHAAVIAEIATVLPWLAEAVGARVRRAAPRASPRTPADEHAVATAAIARLLPWLGPTLAGGLRSSPPQDEGES